jgi:uncharacterized phage-associated protein
MADLVHPSLVSDFLLCESRERGDVLTNLKLQKLLYYSQAWFLAEKDREIFAEDFQAWVHGPVLPSQYHRFKESEWRPIVDAVQCPALDVAMRDHLVEVIDVFGSESAVSLELMTHREQPWLEARGSLPPTAISNARISKDTMRDFYRAIV